VTETITVETKAAAPIEEVWRAYLTPEHIRQWNAASDDWHTTAATVDLRVGGTFSYRMEAKDGSFGFDFAGVYTKIVERQLIEYEFGDRKAKVEFWSSEDGVSVRVTFDSESTHSIEQQRNGWQAILNKFTRYVQAKQQKVRTCLWFDGNGHEAARYYVSLLPDSFIETEWVGDPPLVVEFTLAGAPMMILNGGPHYKLNPAASISVLTKDQTETDRLWTALLAGGGEESMCGWLVDRYGVSWQITPEALMRMQVSEDQVAAERARQAMYKMRKIDIAALEAAFRG
jgi:predicted 3-demethylubiquinone-9 3-methyltransferase (glyoxalase superfamily)/uncharacterized protein YndB with AHSA1/START domain